MIGARIRKGKNGCLRVMVVCGITTNTDRFGHYRHKSPVHVALDSVSCLRVVWLPFLHVVRSRYLPLALAASLSGVPCQHPNIKRDPHVSVSLFLNNKEYLLFLPKEPRFRLGSRKCPLECHHSSCPHISFRLYPAIPSWLRRVFTPMYLLALMLLFESYTRALLTYQTGQTIVEYQ